METKHTPEPWKVDKAELHVFSDRKLVAGCGVHQDNFTPNLIEINKANAHRIVACVNACEGIGTDTLKRERTYVRGHKGLIDVRDALKASNAELAAALQMVLKAADFNSDPPLDSYGQKALTAARAALAKLQP